LCRCVDRFTCIHVHDHAEQPVEQQTNHAHCCSHMLTHAVFGSCRSMLPHGHAPGPSHASLWLGGRRSLQLAGPRCPLHGAVWCRAYATPTRSPAWTGPHARHATRPPRPNQSAAAAPLPFPCCACLLPRKHTAARAQSNVPAIHRHPTGLKKDDHPHACMRPTFCRVRRTPHGGCARPPHLPLSRAPKTRACV